MNHPTRIKHPLLRCAAGGLLLLALSTPGLAQYAERAGTGGSPYPGTDVSGRSIKNKRVRAIHSKDATRPGTTGWMLEQDPFLAYQLGRNINFREFRLRDGVLSKDTGQLFFLNPDGFSAKITADNHLSCSSCHNLPPGNAGGGTNFSKDSGFGRNSPHYYGAGLVEMITLQARGDLFAQIDTNGDGWVSAAEANAAPSSVTVETVPGGPVIDYGNPQLDFFGEPQFNNIIRVWYVDQNGQYIENATHIDGVTVFGYNFNIVTWGWGQGEGRAALNPTNRAFLWDPFQAHSGLEAYDPTTLLDPDGDGITGPSISGAPQFMATNEPRDEGVRLTPFGWSLDDPDKDGHLNEISEGDLDLGEWFMLNVPEPAFRGTQAEYDAGLAAMQELDCTSCHVADWYLRPRNGADAGDRRLFDLDVTWNAQQRRLEGSLVPLFTKVGNRYVRRFGDYLVEGLFSDMLHHNMGKGFEEVDFGGTRNRVWRTPPLWGVGNGFPWGHDGRSLTLEEAILRHDGEGSPSRNKWLAANDATRAEVLNMLRKMVLYDVETLPCDINGDGAISAHFKVAGIDTLEERFNAEWLFRIPVQIQGPFQNADFETVMSFAAMNVDQAYGQDLQFRVDSDDDGWPDVWDPAPTVTGYKDGRNN